MGFDQLGSRPADNEDTPKFLKKELKVTIGGMILQTLGRKYDAALARSRHRWY